MHPSAVTSLQSSDTASCAADLPTREATSAWVDPVARRLWKDAWDVAEKMCDSLARTHDIDVECRDPFLLSFIKNCTGGYGRQLAYFDKGADFFRFMVTISEADDGRRMGFYMAGCKHEAKVVLDVPASAAGYILHSDLGRNLGERHAILNGWLYTCGMQDVPLPGCKHIAGNSGIFCHHVCSGVVMLREG